MLEADLNLESNMTSSSYRKDNMQRRQTLFKCLLIEYLKLINYLILMFSIIE